jgi:Ca-activated chloride channel homolog
MPVTSTQSMVRSHSSGRSPWSRRGPGRYLLFGVVTVVLVAGGAFALTRGGAGANPAAGPTCSGTPLTISVVAPSGTFPVLDRLATAWTAGHPGLNGRCLAATVSRKESSQVAATLSPGWDTTRDGVRPDVWIPESSLWLSVAAGRPEAAALLPASPASIASSPVVVALRADVAQALGWPQQALTWPEVVGAFITPGGWAKLGHPEWSQLRIGMVEPAASTAGLAAVISILDQNGTGTVTDAQLVASLGFTQTLGAVVPDGGQFFTAQANPASTIAAFPALETDVAAFNRAHPDHPLAPVYPAGAPIVADYPYTVLDSSWVDADIRAAAEQFLKYLQGNAGQDAFGVAMLRAPDRSIRDAAALPAAQGFLTSVPQPRVNPNAATLSGMITQWTALERQSNVLLAVDTSGSMALAVPGTQMTRMQLMQQTASSGFALLTNQSNIGLWDFSSRPGAGEFRQLVGFGPATAALGSVTRQQAMLGMLAGLKPAGDTPLYDTIYAGFKEMQKHWEANSTNAVLLITDGANDLPGGGGMTLSQLLARLTAEQQPDRPVQVISIAVGPEADAAALQQISQATGGRTFVEKDPAAAVQTLVLAFAGRLS